MGPDVNKMCCVACKGQSPAAAAPEHVITDVAGRQWRFEQHHFCGPIVLRQDGQPKVRQPGSRSRFWAAYETWKKGER